MDFERLTKYLDSLGARNIPARDLMVTIGGETVYRHFSGARDEAGETPMDGREAYWVYSMTKPLTMACALKLIEEGKLKLDDCVCEYIPAFSKYPSMTIEHLMSMRGGLDYDLNAPAIRACGPDADTKAIVAALAEKPLSFEPGTDFQYSLCHDVVAGVIEAASGMTFGAYMKKSLFDPLGMENSGFAPTEYHRANLCAHYQLDETQARLLPLDRFENPYRLTANYESGGAGLLTTVEDYMRFSSAMACGGAGVLSPGTIDLWRARVLTGKAKASFDLFGRLGYNYALGVRVLVDPAFAKSPVGEFGWDGAAGAYTLIDPRNRLAAVYAQHVRGMGYVYTEIHPMLRDLIYEGAEL
jgi:CubicO group peptidase (beta-lactamase class C family)